MLKMIKSPVVESAVAIADRHPGCMYILTDLDNQDKEDPKGKLYCLSDSSKSHRELVSVAKSVAETGISVCMLGIYTDCFAAGLQCRIEV